MSNNEVKTVAVASVAAILVILLLLVGGYTKAQNDQAYMQIIADNMSQEGFEEFIENKQMHDGNSW